MKWLQESASMMNFIQIQRVVLRLLFAIVVVIDVFGECANVNPTSNIAIDCADGNRLVVKGDSISIAEVIQAAKCWSDAKQIDIFAFNTVIFDDDIDKREQHVNITIISPTWEIIPFLIKNQTKRQIHLNANREFNFIGMCMDKINSEQLHFQVDDGGDDNKQIHIYNNGKSNIHN